MHWILCIFANSDSLEHSLHFKPASCCTAVSSASIIESPNFSELYSYGIITLRFKHTSVDLFASSTFNWLPSQAFLSPRASLSQAQSAPAFTTLSQVIYEGALRRQPFLRFHKTGSLGARFCRNSESVLGGIRGQLVTLSVAKVTHSCGASCLSLDFVPN
jgi:hypothetical protein